MDQIHFMTENFRNHIFLRRKFVISLYLLLKMGERES